MKHLSNTLVMLLILLSSCEGYKPEVKNEVFDISTDSLYLRCADLRGLGSLHIGETRYKDLKKDKGLTTDFKYIEPDYFFGNWGTKNHEMSSYIKKNAASIKQIEIGTLSHPYKIGEYKLEDTQLAFLNDTLVAISLGSHDYYTIKEALIQKYGDGQGFYRWYLLTNGKYGKDNLSLEKKEEEVRVWENEKVKFERQYYWSSKIVNKKEVIPTVENEHCLIYSKNRYSEFEKLLNDAKESYKQEKAKKRDESVNLL